MAPLRGTRPTAIGNERGKAWSRKDLAEKLEISVQAIGNYINHQDRPRDGRAIERALFGDSPTHQVWKIQLEAARVAPKGRDATEDFVGVPSRVERFFGRREELQRLDFAFTTSSIPKSECYAVVIAMGGCGKTSLAAEYAHENAYKFHAVWWLDASSRSKLALNLSILGKQVGFCKNDLDDIEIAASICISALRKQAAPWLLIYDNVESPAHLDGLLSNGNVRTLITTRYSYWKPSERVIRLELLTLEESKDLLRFCAEREHSDDPTYLAGVLDGLPLALTQAGATCRLMGYSFSEYAAQAHELLSLPISGSNYLESVFVTFSLAIKHAEARVMGCAAMMYIIGFCSPDLIPFDLLICRENGAREDCAALMTLIEWSLLGREASADGALGVRAHRLVQSVARDRAHAEGKRANSLERLIRSLCRQFPRIDLITASNAS